MFFVLSKIIEDLLLPSNAITVLAVLGVALVILSLRRTGTVLLVIAAALLVTVGWLPLGNDALLVLENRFPKAIPPENVAGIVLLGGAIDTHVSAERDVVALNDAGERVTTLVALARHFPQARIILSGGLGHLFAGHGKTESAYTEDLLVGMGVPADRLELDEKSRNTCENAVDSKAVANPHPDENWLLVTSAAHMPRSMACFRKTGFSVIPYPVDYRTRPSSMWAPNKSVAVGLDAADLAVHEWLGLAAYHFFKGTELFPASDPR